MLPNERTTRSDVGALPSDMEGLVVAPSRDEARELVSFLRKQRLNVQLVTDVEIAFEEAMIHPPDVILIDDNIAPAGGIELCQRLKGNSRTHFTPVVLWAPTDQRQYRLRALEAGADAVFAPDTDAQERRTRLWALLRSHQLYRRQERRQRSQGSAIRTRRRWVDAFIHDLQNSISALQANFEFLTRGLGTGAGRARDNAEMDDCLHDTRGIFGDMIRGLRTVLDFERFEAGKVSLRETRVAMIDLAREVAQDLGPQASALRKRIVVHGDPGCTSSVDRELMRGALYNLVAHALRGSLNDDVKVSVSPSDDGGTTITVRGSGNDVFEGVDEARIFEPYARAHRQAPVGHGLGLALARAVAEIHGGRVNIERDTNGASWSFLMNLAPGAEQTT